MAPEHVQAARCIRCGLGIVVSDGVDGLQKLGWVELHRQPEEEGTEPLVRPMLCPKCAGAEPEASKGRGDGACAHLVGVTPLYPAVASRVGGSLLMVPIPTSHQTLKTEQRS